DLLDLRDGTRVAGAAVVREVSGVRHSRRVTHEALVAEAKQVVAVDGLDERGHLPGPGDDRLGGAVGAGPVLARRLAPGLVGKLPERDRRFVLVLQSGVDVRPLK